MWLVSLVLVLVTLALYWPVRHYDFVEYDDPDYVFENQTVCNGISWYGLAWSVVDAHAWNWHPVTWISHMLDCQLFGVRPGAHHLVNVALHCLNSLLLFLLLRRMSGALWRSALVAALFAWHPLRVESVAWIAERKDVLSGFFFMLTLRSYCRYAGLRLKLRACLPDPSLHTTPQETEELRRQATRWYYVMAACFVLGLLSKPMLVTVPFVLLLLDYWPLGRIRKETDRLWSGWRIPGEVLRDKVLLVLLSLAVGGVTVLAQHGTMVPLHAETPAARFGSALAGYFEYLGKIFWPRDLAVLYLRPEHVPVLPLIGGVVVLVGLTLAAVMNLRSRPYFVVGWFWFLGMLMPVNGLMQTGLQSIADRYTYLPAIGIGLIAAWELQRIAKAMLSTRSSRLIPVTAASAILITCALLTQHQVRYWQNTQTLMEHALDIDPNNYVAHQDLGRYYWKIGKTELARMHRQRVRELDPSLRPKPSRNTTSMAMGPSTGIGTQTAPAK